MNLYYTYDIKKLNHKIFTVNPVKTINSVVYDDHGVGIRTVIVYETK